MKKQTIPKITIIFLILILSLASISISYSGFTDEIKINGKLKTGEWAASISDYVWLDENQNGIQDPDEQGLLGVTVNLYDEDGNLIDTDITDENGYYIFDDLYPGSYYLEFIPPEGYIPSPMDTTGDTTDSDADPLTGLTPITTLDPGENDLSWDAGFYKPDEGCSHGYWKNHEEDWMTYTTDQTLSSVFTFPSELSILEDYTLLEALNFGGGNTLVDKAKTLMIQATAAVLNAAHTNVNYPMTETHVINDVNNAIASLNPDTIENMKDILDDYNNLGGCLCN